MRNGKLRHKMTLQEPVTTQDTTTGEMVTVWTDVAKVWASLEPLSVNSFVAAGAEQSEVTARVTIRYREGVTSKMRLVYRSMYYDIKGVLADPKSGLEYLTLPVGEGVRYENPAPPAPPVCTITLTGDIAAAFGGEPLDISGQVVSKTVPESPPMAYIATGSSTISGWSGWRSIGYKASDFTTAGGSENTLIVMDSTYTTYVGLLYTNAGSGWVVLVSGVNVGGFVGTSGDKVAIRVDGASGDVELRVNGVTKTKVDIAALGGLFSGAEVFPAAILGGLVSPTLTEGDTYSAQIYTAAADLADVGFPAGTLDWCGNPI